MTTEATDAPSFAEVIEEIIDVSMERLVTWFPGKVQTFNDSDQTVNVEPLVDGQNLPVVQNVPVTFPGGVYWDIQAGETGLVLVGRWDYRGWWRSDEVSVPEDNGHHDLAYATYIPGLFSQPNSRTVGSNSTYLLPQVSGGKLYLGDTAASERILHGDSFVTSMTTIGPPLGFLPALSAWVTQVDALGPFPGTAALQTAITNLNFGLPSWRSTNTRVD
jgi:hypothetical protein